MDFHSWKSNLKLIIELQEQHYNNPNHIWQLCPQIRPMPMEAMSFGLRRVCGHNALPIQTSRTFGRTLPHRQEILCLSTKRWGQINISLSRWGWKHPTALEHCNFVVWSLMLTCNHFIVIHVSHRCQWTPQLPHPPHLNCHIS